MRRLLKWTGRGVLALLLTTALVVVAGRYWIASESGLGFIAGQATSAGVRLDGLAGDPLGRLAVRRAEVLDADGAWLTVEDAVIEWRPWALLARRVEVTEISARRVAVDRAPAGEPDADETASTGVQAPPVDIEIARIAVAEIELGEALTGTAARLNLAGRAGYAKGAADLRLNVERLDGPGALMLDAAYRLADDTFDIDLAVSDPAGGLTADLLGLKDGVEARLDGSGDLTAWSGGLVADSGADRLADLRLDVARSDGQITLRIDGSVSPTQLLPPEAAPLVGDSVGVALAATATEDGAAIGVQRLTISTAAADLAAEGDLALDAGTVAARAATTRLDADVMARLAPDVALATPNIAVEVSGALAAPTVRVTARLDRMTAGGATLSGLRLDATAQPVDGGAFDWTANLAAASVALDQPAIDPILAGGWTATGSGRLDPAADRFPLTATVDGGKGMNVRFVGAVSAEGAADGQATARVADLAPFSPLAGVPLDGPGAISATVALGGAAGLALRDIDVDAVGLALAGRLDLDGGFERIDGAFDLAAPDLRRIGRLVDAPVAGAMTGAVAVSGPLADPASTGEIRFRPLEAAGQKFESGRIRFDAQTLASGPTGQIQIDAASAYGALRAATRFALTNNWLDLTALSAQAPGAMAAGRLAVDLGSGVATGDVDIDIESLETAARPFGVDVAGAGGGRVRLTRSRGGQGVAADLTLRQVKAFGVAAGEAALTAEGGIDGKSPLDATLDIADLAMDGATVRKARLRLKGPLADADVGLAAEGQAADQPFDFDLSGDLALSDSGQRFRLRSAAGNVAGEPFALAEGLAVRNGPQGVAVTGLDLTTTGVAVKADAALENDRIDLNLKQATADLGRLVAFVPDLPASGQISATGRVQGPLGRPEGRIEIVGRDLTVVEHQEQHVFGLEGALALGGGALKIDLTGVGLGGDPIRVAGTLGLAASAGGPPAPGPDSPLDLRIDWTGPLGPVVALAPLDDHRLTGTGAVDLQIRGTVDRPDVQGSIVLADGRYEHLEFGTALAFARIEVLAKGQSVELTPFTAKAGDGTLSASANALMDGAQGYPFTLEANLANARLAARDDVTADASGELRVESGAETIDVFARITTDRIEVELIGNLPASIPTLDVTEVGPLPFGRKPAAPEDAGNGKPVNLDVQVSIPGKFFVRGRGLESEWGGDIAVTGTAAEPTVNGQLDLRRGAFDLVGKRLQLTEGSVRLEPDASKRLEAIVDVLAEFEGSDFTVAARVAGPATDPKLVLSSTPELPRDEILSRLLFNKNAGALTAEESLQLAVAAASLTSGGGGGFDPVGEIRRATGIDTLRVDVGGEAGPAVEAGKYLTDDIYVGVRQGAAAGQGAVTVEVEVFDSITLESEAAQDGSQKVGARLKWDY